MIVNSFILHFNTHKENEPYTLNVLIGKWEEPSHEVTGYYRCALNGHLYPLQIRNIHQLIDEIIYVLHGTITEQYINPKSLETVAQ